MVVTSSLVCVVACSEEGDEGGHLVAVSARAAREEYARGQADVPLLSRRCSACTPRVLRVYSACTPTRHVATHHDRDDVLTLSAVHVTLL